MDIQLSQKEQEIIVLEIVDACIQYSEENQQDFAEVLEDLVFAGKADTGLSEMVCKTIESLHNKGYITGTVELEYELEFDKDTLEESTTDAIDLGMSTFANIAISPKGKEFMGEKTFKELGKNLWEKSKPVVKCIASTVLATAVETAMVTALKAVGFPV